MTPIALSRSFWSTLESDAIFFSFQSLNVKLDVASYNILLKACCLAKRVDLAQDIYEEIKCIESTRALELDVITYSTMIKVTTDIKPLTLSPLVKRSDWCSDLALSHKSSTTVDFPNWISGICRCKKVANGLEDEGGHATGGCQTKYSDVVFVNQRLRQRRPSWSSDPSVWRNAFMWLWTQFPVLQHPAERLCQVLPVRQGLPFFPFLERDGVQSFLRRWESEFRRRASWHSSGNRQWSSSRSRLI